MDGSIPVTLRTSRTAGTGVAPTTVPFGAAVPALPTTRPEGAPRAFHVLAKPVGAICNLDCTYCFYLAKESLYPGDRFRMADEMLERYLRQLLEAHQEPEVTVAWQGGEPTLMGTAFFRRAFELAERHRRPGQTVVHTVQTNGTLLTDEMCALFAAHGVLVGISIDGPAPQHDAYRLDKRGRPTFDRVMRGLGRLRDQGVDYNVLCTVNAANQDHPLEVYRFLRDEAGARHIQLIPVVGRLDGAAVSERSVDPHAWGRFLVAVFDEWVRRDVGTVFVPQFDSALASWLGLPPPLCIFDEECGRAVALEHNGDLYSCDHYVDADHLLGNIAGTHMIELVSSPAQRRFGAAKRTTLPRYCRDCDVRFACQGECPKNRFVRTPDGEDGLNYLCPGYMEFFHHISGPMAMMADLVRHGGYADEVMGRWAAAGRNEPCPCGSGRKAKYCHQQPVPA